MCSKVLKPQPRITRFPDPLLPYNVPEILLFLVLLWISNHLVFLSPFIHPCLSVCLVSAYQCDTPAQSTLTRTYTSALRAHH